MKDSTTMITPVLRIADKNTLSRKDRTFKEDPGQYSLQKHNADFSFSQQPVFSHPTSISSGIQPKLAINEPGDKYEQEADAVADKIMRMEAPGQTPDPMPAGGIQRKCAHCEEEEKKKLQRKESNRQPAAASNALETYVSGLNNSGQPLPVELRDFYEPRLGYNFSKVKIHNGTTAAQSAQSINALAYTHGNNIVFNSGQYAPHSNEGKRLLGHELAHVVQQSSGEKISRKELPAEEKIEKCLAQKDDILPGNVGLVTHIDRSLLLEQMFGAELPAITARIKASKAARRFICEYGISGMAALVENNFDINAAKKAVDDSAKTKNGRFGRTAMGKWRVADQRKAKVRKNADSIGHWADKEDKVKDDIPSMAAVQNMPAAQIENLKSLISNFELMQVNFANSGKVTSKARSSVNKISQFFDQSMPSGILTESYGSDVSSLMDDIQAEVKNLHTLLFSVSAGRMALGKENTSLADIKNASDKIKEHAIAAQTRIIHNQAPDYSDMRELIKDTRKGPLKTLRESLDKSISNIEAIEKDLPRLVFILKYFLALNDKQQAPPTEAEMEAVNGKLEGIDIDLFFGNGPVDHGSELVWSAIRFIREQIKVRLQMKSTTGNLPALIPTQAEVENYFSALKDKTISNDQVRKAYSDFANAYFEHRGEVSLQDLNISGISDVFSLPTSITGTRAIVCGAYAQMGAALMSRAGATNIVFTLAIRASDEQIKNNTIDSGHAIVKVTRGSGTFYISNGSTDDTEADAMDVAWKHPDYPMHKVSAGSYNEALKKLTDSLSKIK